MSNKPKIYAFCQAGCKWETVHKSDFENSATYVKQVAVDDVYTLPPKKCYKIYSDIVTGSYYSSIRLNYNEDGVDKEFIFDNITEVDYYRDYFYFEILSLVASSSANTITIVYEANGNRYAEVLNVTNPDISNATLKITNANDVFMYNSEANITAEYNIVKLTNVSVSNWSSDATYTDYGYRAAIEITGVTSDMIAEITYGMTEALSGNYAPVCETFDGGIYIYAKVNTAITIPSVLVVK